MAREAVLCGPQGLFARLISSWKGLLGIFWQIKRSKPKPSSVWFSRNQFGFAAKTFFLSSPQGRRQLREIGGAKAKSGGQS